MEIDLWPLCQLNNFIDIALYRRKRMKDVLMGRKMENGV